MKSIRFIITTAFLSLIIFQAGSLWILSQLSYQEAEDQLSTNINNELAGRIGDQLDDIIRLPTELNQLESNAIRLGLVDFNDVLTTNRYFWQNLKTYPILNATFFGTAEGKMFGARHSPKDDKVFEVMYSEILQGGNLQYFSTDSLGNPFVMVEHALDYDPRDRSWYVNAVETGGPAWSPIYLDYSTRALVITAANPVYDGNRKLIGVVGSAFKFTEMQNYLQSLKIGKTGITFLIEKNGLLISTSTSDPFFWQGESAIERMNAQDSENPLIRSAATTIASRYKGFENIDGQELLRFTIDGNTYFGYIMPIADTYGIDWLSITVIPVADFLSQVTIYKDFVLVFALVAILFTILAGLLLSKKFTDPIIQLNKAAQSYAEGKWDATIDVQRQDEIGLLAQSLLVMREKTIKLISTLERRVTELHDTHDYLERLISSANVIIVGLDKFGRVRLLNQSGEHITGYSLKELSGVNWFEKVVPHERYPKAWETFQNYQQEKGEMPSTFENPILTKSGEERIISWRNSTISSPDKSISTISFGIDITEKKINEQELKISDERYRLAQSIGHVGNWEYNIQTAQFWGSDEAKRIYGFDPEQGSFSVDEVESCIPERERVHQALVDLIEDNKPYNLVFQICPIDSSSPKIITSKAELQRDDSGKPLKIIGVILDVTDLKRAEEEIRELNRDLEQRVKNRTVQLEAANKELEAFAYSVSHDLRAPLRHIDGFLDLLQKRIGQAVDDKSQHYIDIISDSSRRMGTLIDDLLSFSRMGRQEISKKPVNLNQLIQDAIKEFELDVKKRKVSWKISELPIVYGERSMLQIVLVNLISNALKFTRLKKQAIVEIGLASEEDNETVFFVRDNGVGFDMKYSENIFGVFQRLHRMDEFEGTGIGLATVRRIINRHGGRTWAEGKVDRGATFYFSLPKKE